MKERDFLKISAYPKPIDREWQDEVEAYIKQHGVKQLTIADNQNPSFDFNGGVFGFSKKGSK